MKNEAHFSHFLVGLNKLFFKSRWRDLNPRPADYESAAIPLSHNGVPIYVHLQT